MARARETYHHPDLPGALAEAALALVAERGVRGFSLAEAARRAGVSGSAPYRHYPDRDGLLAAVGVAAYATLERTLRAAQRRGRTPEARLAAMAAAYVRFAHERGPEFSILFDAGLDKSNYPDLAAAGQRANEVFLAEVAATCGGDRRLTEELALGLRASAHGFATLLRDGSLAAAGVRSSDVPAAAARAARALVAGTRRVGAG
jgi:AcrR family transcriptional regulator